MSFFTSILTFLAVLNPFALFIYLSPIMKKLKHKEFVYVLLRASIISFAIWVIFAFTGEYIFTEIFRISFDSFRIFGGLVVFAFAFIFIVKGGEALIHMHGSLDDMAEEIALPFMVGAATISLTIVTAQQLDWWRTVLALFIILLINFAVILFLKRSREGLRRKKLKIMFDKNMHILLRLTGFFIGSIGVDMVVTGISNLYL